MKNNVPIHHITQEDDRFPSLLKNIPSSPRILYYRGNIQDTSTCVSIVGTRKASLPGKKFAFEISRALAQSGYTIVSGLAFGIDAAAHEGALAANGTTWAVLAQSPETIYPRSHEALAQNILTQGGCIMSEYPPITPPYASQFIARNRIISGLSPLLIVIEAPMGSGALATAKFALKQGRALYVTPGPIGSLLHTGSHQLIRSGGRLIGSVQDMLDDLNIRSEIPRCMPELSLGEKALCACIESHGDSVSFDKIVEETTLKPQEALATLTSLIARNMVEENGIQHYRIVKL